MKRENAGKVQEAMRQLVSIEDEIAVIRHISEIKFCADLFPRTNAFLYDVEDGDKEVIKEIAAIALRHFSKKLAEAEKAVEEL